MNDAASPRDRANSEQLQASDPAVSAFVSASAGSGKTKLLTDRLLRLMLTGAEPARIQCLTFTKAAAAEMAVRLQNTLGRWVTLDDPALARDLCALHVEPSEATLTAARALFARVLDLPGGMRIGTIHAFCQSLLRRFPLEASLSPHFRLVDDRDAEDATGAFAALFRAQLLHDPRCVAQFGFRLPVHRECDDLVFRGSSDPESTALGALNGITEFERGLQLRQIALQRRDVPAELVGRSEAGQRGQRGAHPRCTGMSQHVLARLGQRVLGVAVIDQSEVRRQ